MQLTLTPETSDRQLLTQPQRAEAQAIVDAGPRRPAPCENDHFNKCLRAIEAVLPRRQADDISGRLMVAVYWKKLGSYPKEAIDFLSNHAIENLRWFPTIAECIDILKLYQFTDGRYETAKAVLMHDRQLQFENTLGSIRDGKLPQDKIDTLPDYTKRVAETRGYLRRLDDGSLVIRAKWHGPLRNAALADAATPSPTKRRYCPVCMFSTQNPLVNDCKAENCGLKDGDHAPVKNDEDENAAD